MSSMVSRRPPLSVSTSQAKDFFWMSMRFGTSSTLSRRAKLRRVRRASGEAKGGDSSRGRLGGEGGVDWGADSLRGPTLKSATRQDSTAVPSTPVRGRPTLTDPILRRSRMWRGRGGGGRRLLVGRGEVWGGGKEGGGFCSPERRAAPRYRA